MTRGLPSPPSSEPASRPRPLAAFFVFQLRPPHSPTFEAAVSLVAPCQFLTTVGWLRVDLQTFGGTARRNRSKGAVRCLTGLERRPESWIWTPPFCLDRLECRLLPTTDKLLSRAR